VPPKATRLSHPVDAEMNTYLFSFLILFLLDVLFLPAHLYADHKSGYVTLHCTSEEILREFNQRLDLGSIPCDPVGAEDDMTVEEQVAAKLDAIIERAKVVLNMYPKNFHVNVVILPTSEACSAVFTQKYGKKEEQIAYYSLSEDTIYISATDASLGVIAHELGHAIIDFHFFERPPYHIHELMAQSVEKHIEKSDDFILNYHRTDRNAARIRYACSAYTVRDE
jgi:hypothetical protein